MKQHIVITSADPDAIYRAKEDIKASEPGYVYRNEKYRASHSHLIVDTLDTDMFGMYVTSKSGWKIEITISDDGDIDIVRNFGKIDSITNTNKQ